MNLRVGTDCEDDKCSFVVWAPDYSQLDLVLTGQNEHLRMNKSEGGYFNLTTTDVKAGTLYKYLLDGKKSLPDPASHFQPNGVFGPSQVIDQKTFEWTDNSWLGSKLNDLFFYELHVGTFTAEGTFRAILDRIKILADFGFNAIELMPISQFSGSRNWGYDGVFPFAVQNTYGTPNDLKALVNECHKHKIAVFIDCVYNHLGPEGSCLNDFGPYFLSNKQGRWGPTINLDGALNEGVRNFFLENVLYWLGDYHIDGIRLDAVLTMLDTNPNHFLQEINRAVKFFSDKTGRRSHIIAESGYNIPQILLPLERCGYGFDAQWLDDFQHAIFALLTGEKEGYYRNYGSIEDIIEVLSEGYVYIGGEYDFKRRKPHESYKGIPCDKFIVFSQNHDQIGNRLLGDRLVTIAGFEAAKMAAAMVLLSPYIPLIFMGEEWGETSPFLFFTDYQGKELIENIREGRRREFAEFHWHGEVPDAQSPDVFEESKVKWEKRNSENGKKISLFYQQLIRIKRLPIFHAGADRQIKCITSLADYVLFINKESGNSRALIIANFSKLQSKYTFPAEKGIFIKILDSSACEWAGPGSVLPNKAVAGDSQVISGFGVAVYLLTDVNEDEAIE